MFEDALELGLEIQPQSGDAIAIPTGDIKDFELSLRSYGFTCRIRFWVTNEKRADELFGIFVKNDLLEAQFEIQSRFKPDKPPQPLRVRGIVTEKKILTEQVTQVVKIKKQPVLYREYVIDFADPAQVLWRQHFPCDLLVDQNMKHLIETHKSKYVSVAYNWDLLEKEHAIIALPLGKETNRASFYDFIFWYVKRYNGLFQYDAYKNEYTFSKSKDTSAKAQRLSKLDVADIRIDFPETIRHNVNICNAAAENSKIELLEQEQAEKPVSQDLLDIDATDALFNDRCTLEKNRLVVRDHELRIYFNRFPHITCHPEKLVEIKGGQWSKKILPYDKIYRIRDISIRAQAVDQEITAEQHMPHAPFQIEMQSCLETKAERWVPTPTFQPVDYPLMVEGKILSEVEQEDALTYQLYKDTYSADVYRVKVPLWQDRQIIVPFEPTYFSGHFYFPAYKDARVLIALNCHSAEIVKFLDWRQGARLPADTQGNRIVVGKTDQSNTVISHVYKDAKPMLTIKRTSDKDTQEITVTEGTMILETREEEEE